MAIYTFSTSGITIGGVGESKLNLSSISQSVSVTVTSTGAANIQTGSGNDFISGSSGNDTIDGGPGIDTLIGGGGDDVFRAKGGDFLSGEVINGGSGTDEIQLTGISIIDVAAVSLNSIEIFRFDPTTGSRARFAPTQLNTLTSIIGGPSFDEIDISQSAFTNLSVLNISNIEGVNGSIGNDAIIGLATGGFINGIGGNDSLFGSNGNDVLIGGLGLDTLFGGPGADTFSSVASEANLSNFDVILDFNAAQGDRIRVGAVGSESIFVFPDILPGFLSTSQFFAGPEAVSTIVPSSVRFIYDTSTGRLYFDPDGNDPIGGNRASNLVFELLDAPPLNASNIFGVVITGFFVPFPG